MKRRNFIKFGAVAAIAPIVSSAKNTHEDKIERNKAAMKRFETAINTADEALLNELVDPEAPFLSRQRQKIRFTAAAATMRS